MKTKFPQLLRAIVALVLFTSSVNASAQATYTLGYTTPQIDMDACGAPVTLKLKIINTSSTQGLTADYTLGFNYSGLYFAPGVSTTNGSISATGPGGNPIADGDAERVLHVSLAPSGISEITFGIRAGCNLSFGSLTTLTLTNPAKLISATGPITLNSNRSYVINKGAFLTWREATNLDGSVRNGDLVVRRYVITNQSLQTFNGVVNFGDHNFTNSLQAESVSFIYENHAVAPTTSTPIATYPVTNAQLDGSGIVQPVNIAPGTWLVIEETVRIVGCLDNNNGMSVPSVRWGCFDFDYLPPVSGLDANIFPSSVRPALTVLPNSVNVHSDFECYGQGSVTNSASWINNTTNTARRVRISISPRDPVVVPVGGVRVTITRADGTIEGPYEVNYETHNLTPDYMSVTGINKLYSYNDILAANPTVNGSDLSNCVGSGGEPANVIALRMNNYNHRDYNDFKAYNYFETVNSAFHTLDGNPRSIWFSRDALLPLLPQQGIGGQGTDPHNVFIIRSLFITELITSSGVHISEINLNPGDIITTEWDEYSLCFSTGMGGEKYITSPNIGIDLRDECSVRFDGTPLWGDGTRVNVNAGAVLTQSVSNTAGEVDRCAETADGRVENLEFRITLPTFFANDVPPAGSLQFRLYLQDGLDFDRSLANPFAWGRTQNLGFNNPNNTPTACSQLHCGDGTCDPVGDVIQSADRYNFSIVLRNGVVVPANAITMGTPVVDGDVGDANNQIFYNTVDQWGGIHRAAPASFLYTISVDLQAIGTLLNTTDYAVIRRELDNARVSFDVRAYCPSALQQGPSAWHMECAWARCPNTAASSCAGRVYNAGTPNEVEMTYENAIPLFVLGGGITVNCPGCTTPGTEIVDYNLIRTNVGLIDADLNGEPDPGMNSIPLTHPNRRIVTHGDVMQARLTITMPDGSDELNEDGVPEGCTKDQLDALGYYLDNLYVRFLSTGSTVQIDPTTVQAALVLPGQPMNDAALNWININPADVITNNNTGPAMVRVRASELSATQPIGGTTVTNFDVTHTIVLRASFNVFEISGTSEMFEFNYAAGFSGCDNCTDFGSPLPTVPGSGIMADANPADKANGLVPHTFTTTDNDGITTSIVRDVDNHFFDMTQLTAVWPNAYFWCTNGGNVIRYIPYEQRAQIQLHDRANNLSCNKQYVIENYGNFFEGSARSYDAFPGEYRRFFQSNIAHQVQIPTGYEVFRITANYRHRQGDQYFEDINALITDRNAIDAMISPEPGNALFDSNLNLTVTLTPDEDNIVSNLVATTEEPLQRVAPLPNPISTLTFPLDEENYSFNINVLMRPVQCEGLSTIDLSANWANLYRPMSNIPVMDWNQGAQMIAFNPNFLAHLSPTPNYLAVATTSYNPGEKITPPNSKLTAIPQGNTNLSTSANFIQIPVRIDCENFDDASFPYFLVSGPALQKGLTLVGVYQGNKNIADVNVIAFSYRHYMVSNGSSANPSWIVGIDRGGTPATLDPLATYSLDQNSQRFFTLVFSYDCGTCSPLSDCEVPNVLDAVACLNEDELRIGYGWNCNSYPTFANLADVCGSYDPLIYKVSTSRVGLLTNHYINGQLTGSSDVTTLTSCSNFNYEVELTSCYKGQLDNFNVQFTLPAGVSINTSAAASISLPNFFDLVQLPGGIYQITAKATFGGLPVEIQNPSNPSNPDIFSVLRLVIPMKVNCSFVQGDITTDINATTYCGTPVQKGPFTRTIRTDYDLTQVDNIDLSEIQVQVSETAITVNYNITSTLSHTNLLQITLPAEFVVSGTTDHLITLTVPPTGTGTQTISITSDATSCNVDYPVVVTLEGSYQATCESGGEPCTKIVPLQTATYNITITPFTVTLNNVGPCIAQGTTLTASTSVVGTYTYQWYSVNGNSTALIPDATAVSYTPDANGIYTVEVSNGNCSASAVSQQLYLAPQLSLALGGGLQASLFCGSVPLIATVTGGTPYTGGMPAYTGGWYQLNTVTSLYDLKAPTNFPAVLPPLPSYTSTYTALAGGMYQVTIADANNCSVTQSINAPSQAVIIPPTPVCPGESPTLTFTNLGGVLGTFDVGWYDINLDPEDQVLLQSITYEGDYQAAAVVPGCTLTTNTYHITFKAAPEPFHITPDGFAFTCSNVSHLAHITNVNVNDVNGDGDYYNDDITYLWSNGATTLNDQTFTGVGGFSITAMNTTTGCVASSNSPSFDWPQLNINRNCSGVAGQVLLTASANYTTGLYHWWYTDPTTFVKTEITTNLSGANNSILTVTQTGIYSVTNDITGGCPNTEVFMYENLVVSAAPNLDLVDDLNGRFEGITTCTDPRLFTSTLGCLDRNNYNKLDGLGNPNPDYIDPLTYGMALPGHFMINHGTALSANDWNPGYWQGAGYNSNTFMIVDGTPVQGDKIVWSMNNVPVTMGHFHLFRAMVRNVTTTRPPVAQEPPVVYLRVTYLDAAGNDVGFGSQTQKILFNNTNQQWVELSGFSPTITEHSTNVIPIITKARLELYIADGTRLGRDFALDNISFIPIGLCDDIQTILDNTGRNCGSVASVDFYQKSTCGSAVTFNVFDLATDPGITYSWRNSVAGSPVIATGKTFTVTPTATTSYTLKVENLAKGCFFEQQVKAIVLPSVTLTAPDISVCAGSTLVQLNASGASSYEWSPAAGLTNPYSATPTIPSVTANTVFTVKGTSSTGGCSATKTVIVTAKPLPIVFINPIATSVCVGTPLTLTANGTTGTVYTWTPRPDMTTNGAVATLTLLSDPSNPSTSVYVTGTLDGCIGGSSALVMRKELPSVTLTDASVCSGGFGDFNAVAAATSYVYTWSPASGLSSASSPNPIVAGAPYSRTYTVNVTSTTNCTVVKTVNLTTNYVCGSIAPVYDGVDDRTTVPYNSSYNLGSSGFTVEAWVKLATSQNNPVPTILATRSGASNGFHWCIDGSLTGGKRLMFSILNTYYYSSTLPSTLYDDKCHHLAVTRTAAGVLAFFVDGVLYGTTNGVTGSINTTNTIMTMGTETNGSQALKGSINEIRIWNGERTPFEISSNLYLAIAPSTPNLIGYWRFKQTGTQIAVDESQVRNDGYYGTSALTTVADPSFTGVNCGGPQILSVATAPKVCAGMPVTVTYTTAGISAGTQLNLTLSDANGVFPSVIPAFIFADGTGIGTYTFNAPTAIGTGYILRLQLPPNISTVISTPFEVTDVCKGLVFDGNDVATIPNNTAYSNGTHNFTLEAWVNLNTTGQSATPVILSKRNSPNTGFMWTMASNGTRMIFKIGNSDINSSSFPSIYDGQCHHIAVRRQGAIITFFLDGNPLISPGVFTKNLSGIADLKIGLDVTGNGFKGSINEVRFWNIGRTDADILNNKATVYTSATVELIGYWRFKEITGVQVITDGSALANHGVLGNTSAVESSDPSRTNLTCSVKDRIAGTDINSEESGPTITYYPIPFEKTLNVLVQDFATEETSVTIQIMNVNGVEVYHGQLTLNIQNELHLDLPAGIYMAIIRYNDNTIYQHKVIRIQ